MMWEVLLSSYIFAAAVMMLYVTAWYVVALIWKRNDLADVAWGIGFVVITYLLMLNLIQASVVSYLVQLLVLIWGVRLSSHIWSRVRKHGEDERYAKWRREWRFVKLRSYLQVFLLQGCLMLGVLMPVILVATFPPMFSWITAVGLVVWVIGFGFEVIGDAQLVTFIANPANKGKLMQTGLWRYTRHPNYFGEITLWYGIGIIALATPFWYLALVGPVLINFLIARVSGVPLLEKAMQQRPGFAEYAKRTSVLIPWPPKKA